MGRILTVVKIILKMMSKLYLEINEPYGQRFDLTKHEELEFIGVYHKGKKLSNNFENYRPLFKATKSGFEYLLINHKNEDFFGRTLDFTNDFKVIEPGKILKIKNYNYYYLSDDPIKVNAIFEAWINSNPLVYIGDKLFQKLDKINNYTWAFYFNGLEY